MRKFCTGFIILLIILCPVFFPCNISKVSYADDNNEEIVLEIEKDSEKQLENLNFSPLQKILDGFTNAQLQIFGGKNFLNKIKELLSGKFDGGGDVWKAIISCVFASLLDIMPIISLIIAIALIGSMVQGIRPATSGKSVSNVIHFVTYGIIVVLVLSIITRFISATSLVIQNLKAQMDGIFPILLTLLTAIGGNVSVSVYSPAMALLSGFIINIFTYILLPIFIFSIIFSVLSNLSNNIKLDKITSFFGSAYKWIVGVVFTVFTAFLSVQGITAGSIDGISIKAAKFAIKSYVPILGSYLSDGMGVAIASSNLIKNTVGATGLFLILATIVIPVIEMALFMLALKLVAGIIEPLGNKQIANFIYSLSKSLVLLIALIIGVAFIYFIVISLVMCSANIMWGEYDKRNFILDNVNRRNNLFVGFNRTFDARWTNE